MMTQKQMREHLKRIAKIKTDKKSKASRENGKLGGRPKKAGECDARKPK